MGSKRYGGVPLLSKWANMTQGVATRTLRCSDRDKDTPFNIYGNFDDVLASVSKLAEFMTLRGNLVSNRRTWQMLNRAVQIKCSRAVFQELIDHYDWHSSASSGDNENLALLRSIVAPDKSDQWSWNILMALVPTSGGGGGSGGSMHNLVRRNISELMAQCSTQKPMTSTLLRLIRDRSFL